MDDRRSDPAIAPRWPTLAATPEQDAELMRAFAADAPCSPAVAASIDRTVVVTASRRGLAGLTLGVKVAVREDRQLLYRDSLNEAILVGRRDRVATHAPQAEVVVAPADLPALTPAAVETGLRLRGEHDLAFVPDAAGHGTTLLAAARPWEPVPACGPASRCQPRDRSGGVEMSAGVLVRPAADDAPSDPKRTGTAS
ncbi:glycosyltransferase family protein [Amycolatopsis panacis]|uniref:Uncharacterized protein n=1 Tax=Amycolatopsis panacis TaxID=2340917 RepID=A0A419I2K5_9PSEU|nr:hypothetical protein [Amycolatopsis panacis]RJQ84196.1 hypothetical protein D5S19_17855 [Amycolatopsis panacis]